LDVDVPFEEPEPENVPLGQPVLDFCLPDLRDEDLVRRLGSCLEEWVRMDGDNIVRRRLGLAMAVGYMKWETNKPPSEFSHWYKPHFYSPNAAVQARALLAQCASLISLVADPEEKDVLRTYVGKYCDGGTALDQMQRGWLGLLDPAP
jgi:hypothetical protein